MPCQITGLRADIVPHDQWAIRKWFYANPLWYYHRTGTVDEIIANRHFFRLVDDDLRPLCRLLSEHDLRTTPSCHGHFYPMQRFLNVWSELMRESAQIRGDGLSVTDSENGRKYRFHEVGFALPWNDFDAFHAQAAAHQGIGYIGIILPGDNPDLAQRLAAVAESHRDAPSITIGIDPAHARLLGGSLLNIVVRARDVADRHALWGSITQQIAYALRRSDADDAEFADDDHQGCTLPSARRTTGR
jgi:hypothetical protein